MLARHREFGGVPGNARDSQGQRVPGTHHWDSQPIPGPSTQIQADIETARSVYTTPFTTGSNWSRFQNQHNKARRYEKGWEGPEGFPRLPPLPSFRGSLYQTKTRNCLIYKAQFILSSQTEVPKRCVSISRFAAVPLAWVVVFPSCQELGKPRLVIPGRFGVCWPKRAKKPKTGLG